MRLNKFISDSGYCSRREADRYIANGAVFINKVKAKIGDLVNSGDEIRINGQIINQKKQNDIIFIALNKPKGIVSTTESKVKENIIDFVNHPERIFPIGRLDKDSQGLIFLTNDGDIVNKILRAGNNHEKEYIVTLDKPISDFHIEIMSKGVPILGVVTKKCKIYRENQNTIRIILIQGLNRQIRRMCEYYGYQVTKLERIRIMNIQLNNLASGEWRDLTKDELKTIYDLIKDSKSEHSKADKSIVKFPNHTDDNKNNHTKNIKFKNLSSIKFNKNRK